MKGIQLVSEIVKDPYAVFVDDEQLTTDANYLQKLNTPAIFSGADTPTATATVPSKIGDLYVDTQHHKLYFAEAAVDVNSWTIAN